MTFLFALLTLHSHFTDDMTIDILSDLPMKDSFFFSFKWTAKTVGTDVHVKIEIRSSFSKNLPVVSSVIETGMENYLKKLGKKWIELAADTIDDELEILDSKHVAKKLPPPPVPPKKALPPVPKHLLVSQHESKLTNKQNLSGVVAGGDDHAAPIDEAHDHTPEVVAETPKPLIVPTPDEISPSVSPSTTPSITPTRRKREKVVIVDASPPAFYEEYFYWIMGIIFWLITLARGKIHQLFPEPKKIVMVDIGVNTEPADHAHQSVQ
jgi:hypothetical protein